MSRSILGHLAALGAVALLTVGCGSSPPKPDPTKQVKQEKPKPELIDGIPKPAHEAFVKGVEALKQTPPAYTAAVAAFEEATKAHPDYVVAWLNLAWSYERLGQYQNSAAAYRKLVEKNVTDRGVTLALGRVLLLNGEADQAIVEFESVMRDKPEDLQARNNLAAAYLAKGDSETSLRYVKEVLAVQPKNVPAIVNLGLLYLEQKKLPLALLMFNKALGYDDKNARAQNNLGLTYFRMNLVPPAVIAFEKAITLDPTIDDARLNLASIYLDYLDYDEALKQFKAVRERFPENYRAMIGEANALYGIGEYESAAKLYESSLAIQANNGEALLRVGKIYEEQLAQPKKALEYYIRYRDVAKLPPEHPIAQTIQFLQQADTMEQAGGGDDGGGETPEDGVPADGAEPSPEGGDAPAEGGDAPAEGGDAPAEGGDAPAEGGDAPAEGGDAPAEGGDAPAEGGDAPAEGGDAEGGAGAGEGTEGAGDG